MISWASTGDKGVTLSVFTSTKLSIALQDDFRMYYSVFMLISTIESHTVRVKILCLVIDQPCVAHSKDEKWNYSIDQK